MALIKCPECKKKISDQCENCPICGFPISKSQENVGDSPETTNANEIKKQPFYKNKWFWIIVGVALILAIVAIVLLVSNETKPKYDKQGNPMFVEFTNEVYTNAGKYKGYHIEVKGKVFQVIGDNGATKAIQIWVDPETCEQNVMIYYSSSVDVQQGDFVTCTGYIDSLYKYKNAYGAEMHAPLLYSTDLRLASYIEVIAPATKTIIPENLVQEKHGYKVTIDKVEFSEKETRIFATTTNAGKAVLYVADPVIIQGGKQYKRETNYDAEYEELPYETTKGASCSGIITFPAMEIKDFEIAFEVHSDNYDEKLGEFAFIIGEEESKIKLPDPPKATFTPSNLKKEKYGYALTVDKVEFYDNETIVFLTATNNGKKEMYVDTYDVVIIQNGKQINRTSNFEADYEEMPYEIVKGASTTGVIAFPAMDTECIELVLEVRSGDYKKQLGTCRFFVGENASATDANSYKAMEAAYKYRQENSGVILSIYELIDYLYDLKFKDAAVEYAVEHAEGFYDGGAAYDYERITMFHEQGYSRDAIVDFYIGDMSKEEAEYLVDECLAGRKLTYEYKNGKLKLVEHQ